MSVKLVLLSEVLLGLPETTLGTAEKSIPFCRDTKVCPSHGDKTISPNVSFEHMVQAKLFIKSNRRTVVTGKVSMETMGAAHWTTDYTEGSTLSNLSQQDTFAKNILRKSGIQFELVDLSRGVRAKLKGMLSGIKQTPTLLVGTSPSKRYVGVKEISQYLTEQSQAQQQV